MTLPILISVPHGGTTVPELLVENCRLNHEQIVHDGDEYALEIYSPFEEEVAAFVTTDIARAVLDMNRAKDDIRKDGVVKTHTCWNIPIWKTPITQKEIKWLLDNHHKPYHQQLSAYANKPGILLAVDCHTMAEFGPPVGPDPGVERPQVCLGNANGESCPDEWMVILQKAFQYYFPGKVAINQPFSGGYITQLHGKEMPWVQLELSRGDFATPTQKNLWVRDALIDAVDFLGKI
ncbi:MAG: N-formylglutamate amidohydrolase [Candidatus Thiodiazotropha endolucinida]